MIEFSADEIAAYYRVRVPGLKKSGAELRGPCPIHAGKDPNFTVNLTTGQAHCHSQCQRGWDVISLEEALTNVNFIAAKKAVFALVGRPEIPWQDRDVEATYDYRQATGEVLYQVVRRHGKVFAQRRPDGLGGWLWGLGGAVPIPFHLPELIAAQQVLVCEGERDVLRLEREGFTATCNNGGAGNFKIALVPWFKGKQVAIFHDNDEPGRQHAVKVAALLSGTAQSVKIVEIPDLVAKGDVTDFLDAGGTAEQLQQFYLKAQEWSSEWEFSSGIPNENDRYVRTLTEEIEAAGGFEKFWDFSLKPGVPTPWDSLTKNLGGGMRQGEVYILGANQGSGKTSLALQFCTKALRTMLGVLMYSMEMGWRDVFQRLVAMEARVDLLEYRDLQIRGGDTTQIRSRLTVSASEIARHPFLVSTKTRVTPDYVVKETARLQKRQPIHLVIVDHMQLMAATGNVRSDYEKFTAISRAMKETAREVGVPILLVSQTSRANSADKRSELEVSDLRGSGALEEDAAAVMLLYPDKQDVERATLDRTISRGPVKTWLKLGKNRYGLEAKALPLFHFKNFTRFDTAVIAEES